MATFKDLDLSNQLYNSIQELGFIHPTPIQDAAYSVVRSGKDIVGIAQTGTGKTFAYMLPILRDLKFSKQVTPRVLVVVPTRELVLQVVDEIEKLVDTTKKEGAEVLMGGKRPSGFNKGFYYEPTVFDKVEDNFTIMKEEPFGPLVPMLAFKSFDEVIERANDNDLGLCSYIYTNSMDKANRGSELLETGCVAVNTGAVAIAEAPFGGIKQTGYGREGGSMAIKDYLNVKYTHMALKA